MIGCCPQEFLTISDCLMDELPRPELWDWFVDRDVAEPARSSAAPHAETLTVAMSPTNADAFMAARGGAGQPYFELLRARTRLPAQSRVLGFEVFGAEWSMDFHSWHCHGYATEACEGLGVRLNEFGLLKTLDDATTVLNWMLGQPPENQPEPVPWTVVALART